MDRFSRRLRGPALLLICAALSTCAGGSARNVNGCSIRVIVEPQGVGFGSTSLVTQTVSGPDGRTLFFEASTTNEVFRSTESADGYAVEIAERLGRQFESDPRCGGQVTEQTRVETTTPTETTNVTQPLIVGGIVAAVLGALGNGSATATTSTP